MSRHVRCLAVAGLVLLFVVPSAVCAAEGRAAATAWRVQGPITFDGSLSEWNLSSPLLLQTASQLILDAEYWAGPEDASAKIYLMWDETSLYIGAEVTEDTPFGAIAMLPIADNDNLALYISTDPGADLERTTYTSTDFRLILVTDNLYWDNAFDRSMVSDLKQFWSMGMDGSQNVLTGYEHAARATEMGYTMELKIPWANFSNRKIPILVPADGMSIGFNLVLTDIAYPCPGTEVIPRLAWTGDATLMVNPSIWGVLTFRAG